MIFGNFGHRRRGGFGPRFYPSAYPVYTAPEIVVLPPPPGPTCVKMPTSQPLPPCPGGTWQPSPSVKDVVCCSTAPLAGAPQRKKKPDTRARQQFWQLFKTGYRRLAARP